MQITKNFQLAEFACKDGTPVPDKYITNAKKVAENLQLLRDHLNEPIHINSAYRSPAHNKKVGGKPASQHLTASAADIACKSKSPKQLAAIIEKLIKDGVLKFGGMGVYPGFVHVDIRDGMVRW